MDGETYKIVKCGGRWTAKYMDEIPSGRSDLNNGCSKLDLETHDRIDSVWLFLLFYATCSLVITYIRQIQTDLSCRLDPYFSGTELGIWK